MSKVLPEVIWRAFRSEADTEFVFETEDRITEWLGAGGRGKDKTLEFAPADSTRRQLVHRIAQRFGLETETLGEGGDKHVVVAFSSSFEIPETSLRETYASDAPKKAAPAPALPPPDPSPAEAADDKLAASIAAGFKFGLSAEESVTSAMAAMKTPSYDPTRFDRRTFDHVIQLRSVLASMPLVAVGEVLAAAVPGIGIQDILRTDDGAVVVTCNNAESAQKVLDTFSHPTICVIPIAPTTIRAIGDSIPPPIRPATTKAVASRLISSALGGRSGIRKAQQELEAIREAAAKPRPAAAPAPAPERRFFEGRGPEGDWRQGRGTGGEGGREGGAGEAKTVKGRGAVKFGSRY